MAIGFGKSREEDVVTLIGAKKYARAIEVLKAQLTRKGANPSLRIQLADVLVLADKRQEAVALLLPLADQFARDGFAAKAVSVLKKIQKIDPGRREVEERLARQIEERQREAVVLPLNRPGSPPGVEEIPPDAGPVLEIGFESMAPVSAPVEPAPPEPAPPPAPPAPVARAPRPPRGAPAPEPTSPDATLPVDSPLLAPPPAPPVDDVIEDYDLMYVGDEGEEEEEEIEVELVADPAEAAGSAEPMSAGQFADELLGLVDSVFQEFTGAGPAAADRTAPVPPAPDRPGSQIVVSPLFRDFSVDEMVAVIQGLKLLTFERGEIILREGQPGGSLYTLTSGRVRVFKKDSATGRQKPVGDLTEGAFFGEVSILTGQPRTASIVALSRCELLELDRATLDGITKAHPHVWDVLREFAGKRAIEPRR